MTPGSRRRTRRDALALGAAAVLAGACQATTAQAGPRPPVDPGPPPTGPARTRGDVTDVRAAGARGDGVTDDTDVVRRAITTAAAGSTVFFPAGTYLLRTEPPLRPAPGVLLAGEPGRSRLLIAPRPPAVSVGLELQGADVALDGLVLDRATDTPTVLLAVGQVDRLTLARLMLLGHTDRLATYCHGIQMGTVAGTNTDVALTGSVLAGCEYGLYQANRSTAVTQDMAVDDCRFVGNRNTDLEFNSPSGSFRRVAVRDCRFSDHDAPGFAVGVAYGASVDVRGCTMTDYRSEAVHIEDYAQDVTVENCRFTRCGLQEFAHVQIIAGATGITVAGNTHDALDNRRPIPIVGALAGGDGSTAGGRPIVPPTEVRVTDNVMRCARDVRAISFEGVVGGLLARNRIDGPGAGRGSVSVTGGSGVSVQS